MIVKNKNEVWSLCIEIDMAIEINDIIRQSNDITIDIIEIVSL